jgi:hypothetical protein
MKGGCRDFELWILDFGLKIEEKSFAHELHEFARKEIGSWFFLASPIKTTAGFSIKRRIGMKRGSCPRIDTNSHEKRINEAVLLFRHLAIQPCFSLKTNLCDYDSVPPSCHLDHRERSLFSSVFYPDTYVPRGG